MKKIILVASLFFASLGMVTAQQAPAKVTAKKEAKMKKAAHKKEMKTVKTADKKEKKTAKIAAKTDSKVATANTQGLKKDGTPDLRLKENKVTAKTTVKKNGTPDMRYKANKKK